MDSDSESDAEGSGPLSPLAPKDLNQPRPSASLAGPSKPAERQVVHVDLTAEDDLVCSVSAEGI